MASCAACLDLDKQAIKSRCDEDDESFHIAQGQLEGLARHGCVTCQALLGVLVYFQPSWKEKANPESTIEKLDCFLVLDDKDEDDDVWQFEVYTRFKKDANGRSQASERLALNVFKAGGTLSNPTSSLLLEHLPQISLIAKLSGFSKLSPPLNLRRH